MIKYLKSTNRFKRSYKKLPSKIKKDFNIKIKLLVNDPWNPRLGTHKLKGKLEECLAFDLIDGFRVLFYFENNFTIDLIDIGSHDKYKVW